VAVLAALLALQVGVPNGRWAGQDPAMLFAIVSALLVATVSRSLLLTVLIGMLVYALLLSFF
jgi:branched-subunit amino acid transport protein